MKENKNCAGQLNIYIRKKKWNYTINHQNIYFKGMDMDELCSGVDLVFEKPILLQEDLNKKFRI